MALFNLKKEYDFLIVGAGLYGAVCGYELSEKGYKVLIIEKRQTIGGNVYTEEIEGICVHKYGPHIFHTSKKHIWDYIQKFDELNAFVNSPIAVYEGEVYNLPFNMNTFNKLWGVITPEEAKKKIEEDKIKFKEIKTLEEQALSLVGHTIYERLIKGYTEKQWGKSCGLLPPEIIKRIPIRYTYDNNYFNDKYQGIPKNGYTNIIEKMIEKCDVILGCDYLEDEMVFEVPPKQIVYTGEIDRFFGYKFGELEYRSIYLETEIFDMENYQGNAVVNYTSGKVPYTRIIEHKHFDKDRNTSKTVISKEYSKTYEKEGDAYYPINDERNLNILAKYKDEAKMFANVHFGGRLGEYRYLNMDEVIERALEYCQGFSKR